VYGPGPEESFMTQLACSLSHLSFRFPSSQEALFDDLSCVFASGFTGIVGANGVGKTTLLQLATGGLKPEHGRVSGPDAAIYCEQRTDRPPTELADFLHADDAASYALKGRLGVNLDFADRWDTLSHGERKRTQIGCAIWRQPALLAIDEPTNHIDAIARELLIQSLRRYQGIGLIVSHDRELLDTLCGHCLWLAPPDATLYNGGYTQAQEQREGILETSVRDRSKVKRESTRLQREMHQRREQAARSHKNRSKRGITAKDHDAKDKIDLASVSGKDGQAGRLLKQMEGRHAQAQARLESSVVQKQYDLGISASRFPGRGPGAHICFMSMPATSPCRRPATSGTPCCRCRPVTGLASAVPTASASRP
jgi:macrolide transport system ATP-binding/permease protein